MNDKVIARELDNIPVKGKNKPVLIYEVLDVPEASSLLCRMAGRVKP